MFRTLLLGRPFGIGTYVHWSFWLLLLYVAFQAWPFGLPAVVASVLMVCAVFGCVVLHELGHALMARRFGIRTHDIYLYPIGGVARLERMPENPIQELLIALAGPAVNVVIATILFAFLGFNRLMLPTEEAIMAVAPGLLGQVQLLALVNVGLVLFNLLPAFPMDGGRVLRALLGLKFPYLRATELAASVGKYMALFLAFYGLVNGHFLLVILAAFVYLSGQQERLMVRMRYAPSFTSRPQGPFGDGSYVGGPFTRRGGDGYYREPPPDVIDVTPTQKY